MNLNIAGNVFQNVTIPLLWGDRAIVQDRKGRISVIDLRGGPATSKKPIAVPEIIGDEPAPGVEYLPTESGFNIMRDGEVLYSFDAEDKLLRAGSLDLPEVQIGPSEIRVGGSIFQSNIIYGAAVGIVVDQDSIGIGARLPKGLAELMV